MNNIISFNLSTPDDVAKQIAARVKVRRLELNLTQEGIATRAGLKFATYRRFEQTGEISLKGLLQIGFALNSMHQAYIIECQRLFILKGTSCILTIKESRKENVRRLHSVAFAYGLVPPFSVFL